MSDHSSARFSLLFYQPGNPEFPTLPDGVDSLHIGAWGRAGSLSFRSPVENTQEKASAQADVGYSDWYTNGIWRVPAPIDFGTITATKQRTLTITNTFRQAVTLTAVDLSAVTGLSLVSPGLPQVIEAFDSVTLTIEATIQGTPAFDDEIVLTVDGVDLPVRVTGRRVVIFNARPQRPMVEQISWLTDNMVTVAGNEQAFSLRHTPRSRVTVEQRITDDVERARLLNQMQAIGFLRCGVQQWWQSREVDQAIADTDTVVQVNTENMEIAVGDLLSFVSPDYQTVVEGEVQSLTVSSVTLTQPIGTAFPLRTSVMPLRFGFATSTVDQATFAQGAQDLRVTIDLIEYDAIPALDLTYFDTHPVDGLPILTHPLYFQGQTRRDQIRNDITTIDSRTGDIATEQREPLGRPFQPVLVRIESLADQHAWRRFLHFVRGSWGVFYVPTGTNDVPLKDPLSLGGNLFTTELIGNAELLNAQAPRRDVEIVTPAGRYFRRINSVVASTTEETVTLSAAIPGSGTVDPQDVRVSWLAPMRIVGDTATFRHLRRGEAELRFQVRGVIE